MVSCNLPCPYCGLVAGQTFVHGQFQCNNCKQNVIPCCNGETEINVETLLVDHEAFRSAMSKIKMEDDQQIRLF